MYKKADANRPSTLRKRLEFDMTCRRKTRRLWMALFLIFLSVSSVAFAATREYEIKAAFIYNFAQFIEWPATGRTTFNIGVIGKDDYGDALQALDKHSIDNKPITISKVANVADAANLDVLVVGASEDSHLPELLNAVKGKPVLTIGETSNFAERGGCIGFVLYRSRLRFEINAAALRANNLKASSKLLSLATVINAGGQ